MRRGFRNQWEESMIGKTLKINLFEKVRVQAVLRLHGKSGLIDPVSGKPAHEVKQYVGTKDSKVVSRLDIFRIGGATKILHRLFRQGRGWVHRDWKT